MALWQKQRRTGHRQLGKLSETVEAGDQTKALSKFGLVSFCLSFLAWIYPVGFGALLLNIAALLRIRGSKGRLRGKGYATTGTILSVIGIGMAIIPTLLRMSEVANRSLVKSNMSDVRIAMQDWKDLAQGFYPCFPTERAPATNQTLFDFLAHELRNPYDEDCSTREIIVFKPWPPPTPLDSILIPPGIIYVYCSKERYAIIGGAENSRPLDLILSSE